MQEAAGKSAVQIHSFEVLEPAQCLESHQAPNTEKSDIEEIVLLSIPEHPSTAKVVGHAPPEEADATVLIQSQGSGTPNKSLQRMPFVTDMSGREPDEKRKTSAPASRHGQDDEGNLTVGLPMDLDTMPAIPASKCMSSTHVPSPEFSFEKGLEKL